MDGDFGATGSGFGDLDDFTQGPGTTLNTGSHDRGQSSPFVPRSPRTGYGDPSGLSSGGNNNDATNRDGGRGGPTAFGDDDNFPPVNGTNNSAYNDNHDDDPFLDEDSGERREEGEGFVAEAYSFGMPNGVSLAANDTNNSYVPPTVIGAGGPSPASSGGGGMNGFFEEMNSIAKTQDTSRQISGGEDASRQRSSNQPQQGSGAGNGLSRPAGNSLELEIDEEARKAVAVVQEQMRKEVESRRKEEEDLKKEQRELAQEELKDFYERRRQQVERRSKANQ